MPYPLAAAHGNRMNTPAGGSAPSTLLDGLVAYYPFESDGNDSTANARNLTAVNTPTYGAGKVSNAVNLAAASSQYFNRADASFDPGTGDFSVMGWLYVPSSVDESSNLYLVSKGMYFGQQGYIFSLGIQKVFSQYGVQVRLKDNAAATFDVYQDNAITLDAWHHIAIVINRDANCTVYVNNSAADYGSVAGVSASITNSGDFRIGTWELSSNYWDGKIDEFGYWSKALTADEVAEHYNAGTGVTYPF